MKITQTILDELTAKAKESPRLRTNLDLRDSAEDISQRMLNAIEPGSEVPVHRHQKTSETIVCLRGRLVEEFYDDLERTCTERIESYRLMVLSWLSIFQLGNGIPYMHWNLVL